MCIYNNCITVTYTNFAMNDFFATNVASSEKNMGDICGPLAPIY